MRILTFIFGPLISLAIFAAAIVGLEMFLRHIYTDVSVGGGNAPGMEQFYKDHYKGNGIGWRDVDYSEEKPENTIRVAAIGDSFTFGAGIRNVEDTWPKLMEKKLKEQFPGKNIQVMNVAKRGADSDDLATILETKVMPFSPDIAVYAINLNDIEKDEDRLKIAADSQIFKGEKAREYVKKYYVVYALEQVLRGINSDTNNDAYIERLYASEDHRNNQRQAFEKMKTLMGDRPVLMGVLPNAPIKGEQTLQEEYDQTVQTITSLGIPYIDVLGDLPAENPPEFRASFFDYHPNEQMQAYFAKKFGEAVQKVIQEKYAGGA